MTIDIDKLKARAERYANDDAVEDLDAQEWGEAMLPWDVIAVIERCEKAERERDEAIAACDRFMRAAEIATKLGTVGESVVAGLGAERDSLRAALAESQAECEGLRRERDVAIEARKQGLVALEVYNQAAKRWLDEKARLEGDLERIHGATEATTAEAIARYTTGVAEALRRTDFMDAAIQPLLDVAADIRGLAWKDTL